MIFHWVRKRKLEGKLRFWKVHHAELILNRMGLPKSSPYRELLDYAIDDAETKIKELSL